MRGEPIVSDLVLAIVDASFEALASHFSRVFAGSPDYESERSLSERLAFGVLDDLLDSDAGEGFSHSSISSTYYRHLLPLLRGTRSGKRAPRGVDRHIWGADYDRRMKSLFPTGLAAAHPHDESASQGEVTAAGRTRVSAIVQQALLRNRRILQMEKATTQVGPEFAGARIFSPSPYYVARRILADPDAPISEIYARAAIRTDILCRLNARYGSIELNYESVSRALDGIEARSSTSKRVRARGDASRGEAVFLRNYLAALGVMALEVEWDFETPRSRIDRVFERPECLFDLGRTGAAAKLSFRLHPDHSELPDAGELLNELRGLPLPIEGASAIFHGGLRFASGGDIVAAITGPFGAGKTSACLSLAAALAPLGCRTLFLSCEEAPDDITNRLSEATPEYVTRSTPLFRSVNLEDMRDTGGDLPWFRSHMLRLNNGQPLDATSVDVSRDLMQIIDEALETAPLFAPFRSGGSDGTLPAFARPVVIVDGLHQLFRESAAPDATIERSLRQLIDRCRERSAVFIFTVAEKEPEVQRLEYLCDLVLQLDRTGFDRPNEQAVRLFRLLKARRQPAMTGAHIMHLSGPKAFRVKPNVSSHAQQSKSLRWMDPDRTRQIRLADSWDEFRIQNRSQTLIYGKGSSGKAGLGLYILHRRPLPYRRGTREESSSASLFEENDRGEEWLSDEEVALRSYEARTLVVSFLYQAPYYREITRRLRVRPRKSTRAAYRNLPDRSLLDVIALYPGGLTPEDFLAKIDNQMNAAELRGLPYTGVMIDGIHNVFIQYPILQEDVAFWPELYTMLRRRGISVVTTHTEFELREAGSHAKSLSVDFEHAQRRAAPLLSVLVSAADYVFELSAENNVSNAWEYRLTARSTLGEDPPGGYVSWNRQACRLGEWQTALSG